MYVRISNLKFLQLFLFFIPFIGLLSFNLSPISGYIGVVFFIIGLLFFKIKLNQISNLKLLYVFL